MGKEQKFLFLVVISVLIVSLFKFLESYHGSGGFLKQSYTIEAKDSFQDNTRIKVLILSYSRSGSSLLAEVLSAHPSTSYYFEPLWQHQLSCESMMTNTKMVTDMEAIVGGLLNCYLPTVNQLKRFSFRKKSLECNKTTISVVKTIRLRMNGVMPWIMKNPNIKIIHLIRDPRAQTKSRLKQPQQFKCEKSNIPTYCKSVFDDLELGNQLPPQMYRLVKYEDIVSDPMPKIEALYQFIGVNFTEPMRQYVYKHFHAETVKLKVDRTNPYGTFKTSSFNNSNISGMPQDIMQNIEQSCKELLQAGKYN